MGRNRPMPPDAYPIAFHRVVRDGGGILYTADLPWTPLSSQKRFWLFLGVLRAPAHRFHPLHEAACARWSVRASAGGLECSRAVPKGRAVPTPTGAIIAAALAQADGPAAMVGTTAIGSGPLPIRETPYSGDNEGACVPSPINLSFFHQQPAALGRTDQEPTMAKTETTYTDVTMDDGRTVKFPGDRKLQKEALIGEDGSVAVRLDFVNGETRTFRIPSGLLLQFAGHGALQKYGDATASKKTVDEMVQAVDDVDEVIQSGSWTAVRESSGQGLSGLSDLAKALVEVSKQPVDVVRAYLKDLDVKTKSALRLDPNVKPVLDRLAAEKAERAARRGKAVPAGVDTGAVLGGLMNLAPAA